MTRNFGSRAITPYSVYLPHKLFLFVTACIECPSSVTKGKHERVKDKILKILFDFIVKY